MELIILLLHISLSIWIAENVGTQRRIGKSWSLFFLVMCAFIPGLIVIYMSPKLNHLPKSEPKERNVNVVIGCSILVSGVLIMLYPFLGNYTVRPTFESEALPIIYASIVSTTASIYFFQRHSKNIKVSTESQPYQDNINEELVTENI